MLSQFSPVVSNMLLNLLRWHQAPSIGFWQPHFWSVSPQFCSVSDAVHRSGAKLYRTDRARQEVRQQNDIEHLVNFLNKTPNSEQNNNLTMQPTHPW